MYPTNASEFNRMFETAERHGWKFHSWTNRRTYLTREGCCGTVFTIMIKWPKDL